MDEEVVDEEGKKGDHSNDGVETVSYIRDMARSVMMEISKMVIDVVIRVVWKTDPKKMMIPQ